MLHGRYDYQHIQDSTGRIGIDEPVMLFRAQDALAPRVLDAYADLVMANGTDPDLVDAIRRQAQRMRDWQAANQKQFPDVPPQHIRLGDMTREERTEARALVLASMDTLDCVVARGDGQTATWPRSPEDADVPGGPPPAPMPTLKQIEDRGTVTPPGELGENIGYSGQDVVGEQVGMGNGTETKFEGYLAYGPVYPGTVKFWAGGAPNPRQQKVCDDLLGELPGGTINYNTGEFSLTFPEPLADGSLLIVDYMYRPERPPATRTEPGNDPT